MNFTFTDLDERWVLRLSNRTLHAVGGRHDADAAVTFTAAQGDPVPGGRAVTTFADAIAAGDAIRRGDVAAADTIFGHLDVFMSLFTSSSRSWGHRRSRDRCRSHDCRRCRTSAVRRLAYHPQMSGADLYVLGTPRRRVGVDRPRAQREPTPAVAGVPRRHG